MNVEVQVFSKMQSFRFEGEISLQPPLTPTSFVSFLVQRLSELFGRSSNKHGKGKSSQQKTKFTGLVEFHLNGGNDGCKY